MFSSKRMSHSPLNASRLGRSHSLRGPNDTTQSNLNSSVGLNKISHNLGLIYNDSILQSYKSPLPIKVNEIIAKLKSQDSSHISMTILSNGHACFSYEKKLLIWKLKKSLKTLQCFELTIPPSRSTQIKPNCVSVECFNNQYVVLVATSECTVRYWPSMLSEYSFVDAKFDLPPNEQVSNLLTLAENHYLIVTSNGNLVSCTLEVSDDKVTPILRKIDTSSRLASVGRRMTSLIFGASGTGSPSTFINKNFQNFKAALRYNLSNDIYILVEKNLQKFKVNPDMSLTLVSQSNMEKLIYESYLGQFPDSYRASVFLHDASITKNSIYVLAMIEDNGYKFAIAEIDTANTNTEVKSLKSFHKLNYNLQNMDIHHTQYRLKAMDNQYALYVFSTNLVLSFTGPTFDFAGESKFNTLGDKLVSSEFYESDCLFFSLNHGILKTKDNSLRLGDDNSFMSRTAADLNNSNLMGFSPCHNNTAISGNISLLGNGQNDSLSDDMSFNKTSKLHAFDLTFSGVNVPDRPILIRLKEAFQLFLRKDENEAKLLVEDIFRLSSMDKKIDFMCVEFSEKLIDDMPSHDPRWAELNPKGKSFNSNLIISNQLKGKLRFHEYFLTFLKQFRIWQRLSVINYNGRDISTTLALEEHGEKLQCALILREQLNAKNPELINAAIEYIAKNREDGSTKNVYPHDIFYRKVSNVQEIFNALYFIENEVIKVNSNEQALNYLIDTTVFFCKLLKTSQQFYKDKKHLYENGDCEDLQVEYVRWSFLPGKEIPSLIGICTRQHKLVSEYGLPNCITLENKSMLLESLKELDSLIFEEYELRLGSIEEQNENDYVNLKQDYDALKTKLIETYVKNKQVETAIRLAEKYVDYNILVSICESKKDYDMLESYLDKFANTNFAQFVIKYFMEKKKLSFLLKNNFLKRPDLSKCFDKYHFLSWIKDIKNEKFQNSAQTLENLGREEKNSVMKKKSLISMSKLNLIANAGFDNLNPQDQKLMDTLNRQLEYLSYFDNLPVSTLKNLGLSAEEIPCYKPEKLIELLINDEAASELEFRKSLELVEYLNDDPSIYYSDEQKEAFKVEILVRSILADNWEKLYYEDYPESKLDKTKFFKSMYALRKAGEDLECLVNLKEPLLNHELTEHLADNKKFSFLLETCFEMLEC